MGTTETPECRRASVGNRRADAGCRAPGTAVNVALTTETLKGGRRVAVGVPTSRKWAQRAFRWGSLEGL